MIPSQDVERRLLRRGLRPRWEGEPPAELRGLCVDSRLVRRGDLFCAIPGLRADGHRYVPQVARAGAAAAVVARAIPEADLPQLVVSDVRRATAHLASLFFGDPGASLRLVGITGTNGKTTTAWIARHLLAGLEPTAALGTLGLVQADGSRISGTLTTPDPVELMETLDLVREKSAAGLVMEVSSHALDQLRVEALRFHAIAFTSFAREHLDYHGDMERYLAAKAHLVDLLRPGGLCVLNADVPAWEGVETGDARVLRYGLAGTAEVRAEDVRLRPDGSRWRLVAPAGSAPVELPLPGEFNLHNALAAAALALEAGMAPDRVAERLSGVPAVPGRMEVLRREPPRVIRDYAHTPEAFELVLGMMRPLASGRLLVVFGCGGERDAGKRPEMGRIAARWADLVFVTSDNPRSEDPAAIAAEVVEGLEADGYRIVLDRREAIESALEAAGPEDVVLLLGKGHESYQVVGREKLPFDEAAIVAEWGAEAGRAPGSGSA
ncbi:MAG: UDP-N-acetylmuramoyl-L-alanyl-D-glutamate--2,6-diaminopimelate ligase [Gemmatimonadota bacterium]